MSRLIALVTCLMAIPLASLGGESSATTVEELLADPEVWGGRHVVVTGELVGDYSFRPEGAWIQVNDDVYAEAPVPAGGEAETFNFGLGALAPSDLARGLPAPGRYDRRGPFVRLEGTFRHSDPRFQGETFLEVDDILVLEPGSSIPDAGPDGWLVVGGVSIASALVIRRRSRASRS